MGTYEVTCATHQDCAKGGHVASLGVTRKKETQIVDVSVARLMISSGDNLYLRDRSSKKEVDLRKGKCDCGVKTVRIDKKGSAARLDLSSCPKGKKQD